MPPSGTWILTRSSLEESLLLGSSQEPQSRLVAAAALYLFIFSFIFISWRLRPHFTDEEGKALGGGLTRPKYQRQK